MPHSGCGNEEMIAEITLHSELPDQMKAAASSTIQQITDSLSSEDSKVSVHFLAGEEDDSVVFLRKSTLIIEQATLELSSDSIEVNSEQFDDEQLLKMLSQYIDASKLTDTDPNVFLEVDHDVMNSRLLENF